MNNVLEAYQSRPRRWWKTLLVTIIVAIILAWSGSSIEFEGIASKGSEVAYGIVHGIANPDLDLCGAAGEMVRLIEKKYHTDVF